MNTRRKFLSICLAAALVGVSLYLYGCEDKTEAKETVELCTKCGQFQETESCCKPDQEKCEGCELDKGSPGCCSIPEGAESAAVCRGCGQIAGGDKCCQPDQEKCENCNLVKGSPGCCKLPKT